MSSSPSTLDTDARDAVDWAPGFELQSKIGAGGYGAVFKAYQAKLDRVVAIKLLRPDVTMNSLVAARFEAEAVVLARLRHPNIVQVIDAGHRANRAYIVMELLEGEDFGSRLAREGPLEEKLAWAIARQVVAALAHAAAQGIVHRDVKPANIFLIPAPTGMNLPPGVPMVKVMDFGLALTHFEANVSADRLTPTGAVVGTPIYMAPEQHGAFADVDHRADIYALGATVVYALTGKPPFRAKTFSELMDHKLTWSPREIAGISRASGALLARMMAPNPRERIGNYEELIARIDDLLNERNLESVASPAPKSRSRRQILWAIVPCILLAAVIAVLVGGAKVVAWRKHAAEPASLAYVRRGEDVALFDKQSLTGWLPPSTGGNWSLETDDENDRVLVGSGFIRRALPVADDYRITIGLDIHTASAAEIHFALAADAVDAGKRLVLRVSRSEGAVVVARDGDRGASQRLGEPIPFPTPAWFEGRRPYLEVKIERAGDRWAVWFNGVSAGRFSDHAISSAPELRLFADGGRTRVDSVIFVPLGPK